MTQRGRCVENPDVQQPKCFGVQRRKSLWETHGEAWWLPGGGMGALEQIVRQSRSWKIKEGVEIKSGRKVMSHLILGCVCATIQAWS